MMKRCAVAGISLLITIALVDSCQIHHGLEPLRSSISGTIFFTGSWPSIAEEVRVAASPSFPPEDPLEIILSDPLPMDIDTVINPSTLDTTLTADSVDFVLFVPPGDYHILVLWKKKGLPWDVSSILGVYTFPSDTTKPAMVKVSTSVQGIDIKVTFPGSSISGTITLVGEWPQNTEWVRLAVYIKKPRPDKIEDFFPPNLSTFSDPFPFGITSYDYLLPVAAGTYEWILVAWKAKGTSLFEIKELGSYPEVVSVPETEIVSGIDIVADFTKIK